MANPFWFCELIAKCGFGRSRSRTIPLDRSLDLGIFAAEFNASGTGRTLLVYSMGMSVEATKRIGPECLGFKARLLSRMITGVYDEALPNSD